MTNAPTKTPAGTEGGAAWYVTTPATMADVVMQSYRTYLSAYGLRAAKVGLINALAAEEAAPKLVGLEERPADEALRTARDIIADTYAKAMDVFSVWNWAINAIEQRVHEDVEETINEHVTLRLEREAKAGEPSAADPAEPPAEEPADAPQGDDGAQLPAEDGSVRDEAAGEDQSGG